MQTRTPGPLDKWIVSLQALLRRESAGGVVLMAAALLALVAANSPLADWYAALLHSKFEIRLESFGIAKPLLLWINDGLMAVFFFVVGLELKREVLEGHLSTWRRACLPAIAALGGMLVPAAIYAAFNRGDPIAMEGWAIPTATDIAFALAVLSLLGDRVPGAVKTLLLSVAVFDDLGAIVVIAIFYTDDLSTVSLVVAGILILALAGLNRLGVQRPSAYLLFGIPLWVALLKSGVHATLAGVVAAMFIPLRTSGATPSPGAEGSLLVRLEHALHPWVAIGVLPLFAFANAGVVLGDVSGTDLIHPVSLGIVAGLFLGKQVGVMAMCWLAIRTGIAARPSGVSWRHLYGTSLLCGIGFTMSLFIASLAFEKGTIDHLGLDRLGILLGSGLSGVAGYLVLRRAPPSARGVPTSSAIT